MAADLEFRQVDVFTDVPFTGNGLIVLFGSTAEVGARALISLTAEMRQFELIVADFRPEVGRVSARIFTAEEELPFAGHPVIGAAAALHERFTAGEPARSWVFVIAGREITVRSRRTAVYYEAEMDQGSPTLDPPLGQQDAAWFARALKFVYLFEPDKREGRSWDNTGAVEDVATGSAAGPAAAFLAAHGLAAQDETILINQGRLLGRPSVIAVTPDRLGHLWVGGPVAPVARGVLDRLPG